MIMYNKAQHDIYILTIKDPLRSDIIRSCKKNLIINYVLKPHSSLYVKKILSVNRITNIAKLLVRPERKRD